MPTGVMAVGRGTFVCKLGPEGQSEDLVLHVAIQSDSISWYQADAPNEDYLERIVGAGEHFSGRGQLVLTSLPATPNAAFYNVMVQGEADHYTIHIQHTDEFGASGFPTLSGLDLRIIHRNGLSMEVSGSLNVDLLGEDLTLNARLDEQGIRFVFADPPPFEPVELASISSLDFQQMLVGAEPPEDTGLIHRYDLTEQSPTELLDSAGSDTPLNLEILAEEVTRNAYSVTITPASEESDREHVYIQSAENPDALRTACQATNELTIEAWIQPTEADQRGPARIISLSEDTSNRNFTLGHGPTNWESQAGTFVGLRLRTDDDYVSDNGRVWGAGFQDERDPIQTSAGSIDNSLQYVVATRDAQGALAMYINGIKAAHSQIPGTFSNWDPDYKLLFGNEADNDRSWAGTYFRVALYNKALPESLVMDRYFPVIEVQGKGVLAGMPAPLNQELEAALIQEIRDSQAVNILRLTLNEALTFSKKWKLNDLLITWQIAPASLIGTESQANFSLWGKTITFGVNVDESSITFFERKTPTEAVNISNAWSWAGLDLTLKAKDNSWEWTGSGEVMNLFLPKPQAGNIAAMPRWEEDRLWLELHHDVTQFVFVERLRQDTQSKGVADLQLGPAQTPLAAWTSLTQAQASGSVPTGFDTSYDILHSSQETQSVLMESGSRAMLFEGDWSIDQEFDLHLSMAFAWHPDQIFGNQFILFGDLHRKEIASFLKLYAEGNLMFSNDGAVLSAGILQVETLGYGIYQGDLEYLGDVFESDGEWQLFRDWSACQVRGEMVLELTKDGLEGEGPILVEAENLPLEDPWLHVANGELFLSADWLGEGWSWQAEHIGDELVLVASNDLIIMGNFEIGPIHDPVTGAKLADRMPISPNVQDRQPIQVSFTTELSHNGFIGRVTARVPWEGPHGRVGMLEVPAFELYQPPRDRNEILELIALEVQTHASSLLAAQVGGKYEFRHLDSPDALRIGLTTAGGATVSTLAFQLPALFTEDISLAEETGTLQLAQTEGACTVTYQAQPEGGEALALESLLLLADAQEGILPGGVALLRSQLAQVLPGTHAELLSMHAGFDGANRFVDVLPGMRLRVEYQNYQYVHPSETTAGTGFVGSGVALYEVVSRGAYITFDSFASRMRPPLQSSYSVAGVFDLQGRNHAYYRLFYPNQDGQDWLGAERATLLVGTNSYNDMLAATNAYLTQNTLSEDSRWSQYSFRGKAVVVPELRIFVNEVPVYVPVGTTVRHLLARSENVPASGLTLNPSLRLPPLRRTLDGYVRIHFGSQPGTVEEDMYDLPVLKGDRFFI